MRMEVALDGGNCGGMKGALNWYKVVLLWWDVEDGSFTGLVMAAVGWLVATVVR